MANKDIIPKDRGLYDDELGKSFPKSVSTPDLTKDVEVIKKAPNLPDELFVTSVISAEKGVSKLKMSDGNTYLLTGGTLSWRNNNPGNIKYGNFAQEQGAVGEGHQNMAVFKSYDSGKKAQKVLLFGPDSKYTKLTLVDAIARYAPSSDNNNNPKEYANYVAKNAKINKTTVLNKLTDTQQDDMIEVMCKMEGFKPGTIKRVT